MFPLPLLRATTSIHPLLGTQLSGQPHVFDFSSSSPLLQGKRFPLPARFQQIITQELKRNHAQWGIGKYMEERQSLRQGSGAETDEHQFHAGLDIIAHEGATLFAPIPATVHMIGREEGMCAYGHYIVLKHLIAGVTFFSVFGHLSESRKIRAGDKLEAGAPFARIGTLDETDCLFTHVHMQILTDRAMDNGRLLQRYVSEKEFPFLESFFPSPYLLFRYQLR